MSFKDFTKIVFNIVWSVVGVAIIILIVVAYQEGSDNIYDNFFRSAKKVGVSIQSTTSQSTATQSAANSNQQVTEEQLSCIANIIGQAKTDGLVKGTTTLTDAEKQQVQPCIASSSTSQGTPVSQNALPVSNGSSANLQAPVSP